tara:strand:- start:146 stop:403 length:258 start_codon:yes stop_codon:yes gene_type:complete
MKWILRVLFLLVLINIIVGYVIRQENLLLGEKWIGFSVAIAFFVFMPLFLAHRWKGKRLQDYTLSNENLKKIKETLEPPKRKRKS